MIQFTNELFVDALILILHSKDVTSVQLVEKLLELYQEETKDCQVRPTLTGGNHFNRWRCQTP